MLFLISWLGIETNNNNWSMRLRFVVYNYSDKVWCPKFFEQRLCVRNGTGIKYDAYTHVVLIRRLYEEMILVLVVEPCLSDHSDVCVFLSPYEK